VDVCLPSGRCFVLSVFLSLGGVFPWELLFAANERELTQLVVVLNV